MRTGIEDKVVVITGASSGIGEAAAELLAAEGAKVVLGARRAGALAGLVERIRKSGGQAVYLQTDITKRTEVASLIQLAMREYGRLDVVVNNAGISQLQLMEDADVEGWEQMIDVNLKGTLYGIAAALPIFKTQGYGHIINMISTAGISIVPTMAVYAATKNAVRTLTEALRQESKGRWRVTGISPGFVDTPFTGNIKNEAIRDAFTRRASEIAIPATAIAQAVAYAVAQPDQVDVGDIVIRPTIQD